MQAMDTKPYNSVIHWLSAKTLAYHKFIRMLDPCKYLSFANALCLTDRFQNAEKDYTTQRILAQIPLDLQDCVQLKSQSWEASDNTQPW